MTEEKFDNRLEEIVRKYGGTVERILPKKESSGPRKVQFFTVNNPPPRRRLRTPNPPTHRQVINGTEGDTVCGQ